MRTILAVIPAVVATPLLACAGLFPGSRVTGVDVQPATPFSASYLSTGAPTYVWLSYDIDGTGTYRVSGPVEMLVDGEPVTNWTLDFTPDGGPLDVEGPRRTVMSSKFVKGGVTTWQGDIHLFDLPVVEPGKTVSLQGTWTPDPRTTPQALHLYVTE